MTTDFLNRTCRAWWAKMSIFLEQRTHLSVEKHDSSNDGGRASTSFIHLVDQLWSGRGGHSLRDKSGTDVDEDFGRRADHVVELG